MNLIKHKDVLEKELKNPTFKEYYEEELVTAKGAVKIAALRRKKSTSKKITHNTANHFKVR